MPTHRSEREKEMNFLLGLLTFSFLVVVPIDCTCTSGSRFKVKNTMWVAISGAVLKCVEFDVAI